MIGKIRNTHARRAAVVAAAPFVWIIYTVFGIASAAWVTFEDVRDAWRGPAR